MQTVNAIRIMVKNATNEAARNVRDYTVIGFMDGTIIVWQTGKCFSK